MSTKTVLVTGSSGYLGSYVVQMLREQKYQVVEYDLDLGCDILDQKKLNEMIDDTVDYVVHLAAIANMNHYADNKSRGQSINVQGTRNIMDVCRVHSIPIFFASTCCAYGQNGLVFQSETSVLCPSDPYAVSKVQSEVDLMSDDEVEHIIMRLATFYGGTKTRKALAIPMMIEKCYNTQVFEVHGSGEQTRTYTHVSDIASGIVALVNNYGMLEHRVYNITVTEPTSVIDIARTVSQALDRPVSLKFVADRPSQFDQQRIANTRLLSVGWRPQYNFRDGIKESVAAFKTNNYQWFN